MYCLMSVSEIAKKERSARYMTPGAIYSASFSSRLNVSVRKEAKVQEVWERREWELPEQSSRLTCKARKDSPEMTNALPGTGLAVEARDIVTFPYLKFYYIPAAVLHDIHLTEQPGDKERPAAFPA